MEECLEDIKMDMHILQEKIEELEYEFSKLSYCDKFCMSFINKCIEWKVYVRKMLKQS
jgi:tRNA A-37 threonylcarbamoyl transferase component Bud32